MPNLQGASLVGRMMEVVHMQHERSAKMGRVGNDVGTREPPTWRGAIHQAGSDRVKKSG